MSTSHTDHDSRISAFCAYDFPDINEADPHGQGLICIGGDLHPSTLICAYQQGLFPWFNEDDPICWWSPEPRCVIYPEQFQPSKSLIRNMKKFDYQIGFDQAFRDIISQCAAPRSYARETWISDEIIEQYVALHELGFAHSVEVWDGEDLIGGLYGLNFGRGFFGESMFNLRVDTSKMAFYSLMLLAKQENLPWVDCQLVNDHLLSLGATALPRADFLQSLEKTIAQPNIDWQPYQNSVFSTKGLAENHSLVSSAQ